MTISVWKQDRIVPQQGSGEWFHRLYQSIVSWLTAPTSAPWDAQVSEELLIQEVQRRVALPTVEEAHAAIDATLFALGERLGSREIAGIAELLPPSFANSLTEGTRMGNPFLSIDRFYDEIGLQAHCSQSEARAYSATVLAVLREMVSPLPFYCLRGQLPVEFDGLLGLI